MGAGERVLRRLYAVFRPVVDRIISFYPSIREDLRKSGLGYTAEEYVAGGVGSTLLTFVLVFLIVLAITLPYNLVGSLLLSLFVAIVASLVLLFEYITYPQLAAKNRAMEMEEVLPSAVMHMSTLSGTGLSLPDILRILSTMEEYGPLAEEFKRIYKDITVFGKDVITALSDSAKRSPSTLWTETVWGMISVLRSGGSLREYLQLRSKEMKEYRERMEKKLLDRLGLIMELYIVLFVLAPVLGVIMLAVMGFIGGEVVAGLDPNTLLLILVYGYVPLAGIVSLAIVNMFRPREII